MSQLQLATQHGYMNSFLWFCIGINMLRVTGRIYVRFYWTKISDDLAPDEHVCNVTNDIEPHTIDTYPGWGARTGLWGFCYHSDCKIAMGGMIIRPRLSKQMRTFFIYHRAVDLGIGSSGAVGRPIYCYWFLEGLNRLAANNISMMAYFATISFFTYFLLIL